MRFRNLQLNHLWAAVVLLLASCGGPQSGSQFIDRVGEKNLLNFVADREKFSDNTGAIPTISWSAAIQKGHPISAKLYFSGVQFVLKGGDREESGVYVTTNLTELPEGGSGVDFIQLRPGFFWFDQKVRDAALARRLLQNRDRSGGTNILSR